MFCANCGKELTNEERFCPSCGFRVQDGNKEKKATYDEVLNNMSEVNSGEMTNSMSNEMTDEMSNTISNQVPNNMQYGVPNQMPNSAPYEGTNAESTSDSTVCNMNNEYNNGKKPRKFKKLIAVLAVLVIVFGGIGIVKGEEIRNFVESHMYSPKKYYQTVGKRNVEKMSETFATVYDNYMKLYGEESNQAFSGTFNLKLEDKGKEMLQLVSDMGVDMTWLKDIGISYDVMKSDNYMGYNIEALLNEQKIMSVCLGLDSLNQSVLLKLPEFSEKYISLKNNESDNLNYSFSDLDKFIEALPKKKELQSIINRYSNIVVENASSVTKSSEKLSVENVSANATRLNVKYTEYDAQKITLECMKEFVEDKDIEKIFTRFEKLNEIEVLYAKFGVNNYLDLVDEIKANISALEQNLKTVNKKESNVLFEFAIWVNAAGDIEGFTTDVDDLGTIAFKSFSNGNKYALDYTIYDGEDKHNLSGVCKKAGNTISGDITYRYNERDIFIITTKNLNSKELKKGNFDGSITFKLSEDSINRIKDSMGSDMDNTEIGISSMFQSLISNFACQISGSVKNGISDIKISLLSGDEAIVSIGMKSSKGEGSKVIKPNEDEIINGSDEDALETWRNSISLGKLEDNLKKAGLPDNLYNLLIEYINRIKNPYGIYDNYNDDSYNDYNNDSFDNYDDNSYSDYNDDSYDNYDDESYSDYDNDTYDEYDEN